MAVKSDDRSLAGAPSASSPRADAPQRERLLKRAGDTLPPTPLVALSAVGGAELLVLSADAKLVDTVQRASRDQLPLTAFAHWTDLENAMAATRRAVVLIDANVLGDAVYARIGDLHAYAHKVVTLVAADRAVAEGLMGLLSERKIHRLLINPPAPGITRLLIDSAVGRCLQLCEAEQHAHREPVPVEPPSADIAHRSTPLPFWLFAAAGAALLAGVALIAGVSAWWRSPVDVDASVQSASPHVVTDAVAAREPAAAPEPPARAGVSGDPTNDASPTESLYADAEAALLENSPAAAATALAALRRTDPGSSRLAFLEAQLARAQARAPAALAPPPATAVDAELESLLTIARARLQRGELLEPARASAGEYLTRAEQLAPGDAAVGELRRELAAALVAAGSSALAAADIDAAGALAREARRRGAAADALRELEAGIAQAHAARIADSHEEWLALGDSRVREGALIAPPDDNARHYLLRLQDEAPELPGLAAAWAAFTESMVARIAADLTARNWSAAEAALAALQGAPQAAAVAAPLRARLELGQLEDHYLTVAVPASQLELLERVAPVYPPEAARRGIEGWVEVEFVVDAAGGTRALTVIAAEPVGAFEAAAMTALARYRYRPFMQNGRAFERLVRLRIRFSLE